jgi:DNA-binding transcriptional LysR family regulator
MGGINSGTGRIWQPGASGPTEELRGGIHSPAPPAPPPPPPEPRPCTAVPPPPPVAPLHAPPPAPLCPCPLGSRSSHPCALAQHRCAPFAVQPWRRPRRRTLTNNAHGSLIGFVRASQGPAFLPGTFPAPFLIMRCKGLVTRHGGLLMRRAGSL